MPTRLFVVGDLEPDSILEWAQQLPFGTAPSAPIPDTLPHKGDRPHQVTETENLSQSKLVMGCRVDLKDLSEGDFDALRIYSSILGGGFHSRLFQSVREEHSLAYYASASLDRIKGLLLISCGIDAGDREQVVELIEKEMRSLVEQPPRDDEMAQAIRLAASSTRTVTDSAGGLVDVLEAGMACGRPRSLEGIAKSLETVTAEQVHRVARRIGPFDVIYCLQGENRRAD